MKQHTEHLMSLQNIEDRQNVQLEESRDPLLTYEPKMPWSHDMNYFVPQFGIDNQIRTTIENTDLAEKITGHKWNWVDPKHRPKPDAVDYFVPNFGVDQDVKDTLTEE
jgi:hypothetical protein